MMTFKENEDEDIDEYLSTSAQQRAKEDFKNIACIGDTESLNQICANTLDSKDYYLSKDVNEETPQTRGNLVNKQMHDIQL